MEQLHLTAPLWRWTGGNGVGWFFLTIDGAAGNALSATALMRRLEGGQARGFGSLGVTARIGGTEWKTSVFPSKEAGGYLLPVKASVHKDEAIGEGDEVTLVIEV